MQAQIAAHTKAVQHDGQPALEFEAENGWNFYITYPMWQGEPALGFAGSMSGCPGRLYVTRTRVSGSFPNTTCENFDVPRSGVSVEKEQGKLGLRSGTWEYVLIPQMERDGVRNPGRVAGPGFGLLARAIENFNPAYANVRRLAAQAQGQLAANQAITAAAAKSGVQKLAGQLTINSDPGDAQVYVNDQPRGMTSEDGELALPLPPGSYRVRLSLPGYKDFEQQVGISSKNELLRAKLEPAGPPPFTAADVTEMLQGKMSPKRVASLVEERGVDFELTPDLEKRLRGMGATSDLLLAIATNRKK